MSDAPSDTPPPTDEPGADMDWVRALMGKAAFASVILVVIAVVVFWFGWVRAPGPTEVCKHKIELVTQTAGAEQDEGAGALIGQLEAKCVTKLERKIKMRGKLVYAEYAKCVMAAETLADAERC